MKAQSRRRAPIFYNAGAKYCTAVSTALDHDFAVVLGAFDSGNLGAHLWQSTGEGVSAPSVACMPSGTDCIAVDRNFHHGIANGSTIAFQTGHKDGTVFEWTLGCDSELIVAGRGWICNEKPVSSASRGVASLAVEGTHTITGGLDACISIWRAEPEGSAAAMQVLQTTGLPVTRERRITKAHPGAVTAVDIQSVAGIGTLSCTSGKDGLVKVWSEQGDAILPRHFDTAKLTTTSMILDLHAGRVCTGAEDSLVRVWDVEVAKSGPCLAHDLAPGRGGVWAVAMDKEDACARILSGAGDGSVRLWDLKQQAPALAFSAHALAVASVSLRGERILSASLDGVATLWDIRNLAEPLDCADLIRSSEAPARLQEAVARQRAAPPTCPSEYDLDSDLDECAGYSSMRALPTPAKDAEPERPVVA